MQTLVGLALSVTYLQATANEFSEQHQQVVALFKSNEEMATKDAVWTSAKIFKIGVIDNGTIRDGYADYACQVLYDYGFAGKKVWVQIIDIVKLTESGKWEKLGEKHCL